MNDFNSTDPVPMDPSDRLVADRPKVDPARPSAVDLRRRHTRRRRRRRGTVIAAAAIVLLGTGTRFWPPAPSRSPAPLADRSVEATTASQSGTDVEWQVVIGPPSPTGEQALLVTDQRDTWIPVGIIEPQTVREVPIRQLEPEVREEIERNWDQAGYTLVHEI